VPTDDCFRGDQDQRPPPTGPQAPSKYPEESVEVSEAWARRAPRQHSQLLTQCQILKEETLLRAKKANQRCDAEFEMSKHDAQLYQNGNGSSYVIDSKDGMSSGE
jgi:hypothetical protein